MIHVHRSAKENVPIGPIPYGRALLGSRRVRAAWQYQSLNDLERTERIKGDFLTHHYEMKELGLRSWEISNRKERSSKRAMVKSFAYWVWSIAWMLGVVSWGAVIGSMTPYLFTRFLTNNHAKVEANKVDIGSIKVLYSMVIYPLWWILISLPVGWFIASPDSMLQDWNIPSLILPVLAKIPWLLVSLLVLIWWPLSARLHLKLYERATRSWRSLRLGFKLNSGTIDWESLLQTHGSLATEMATIGDGLILPGDPDWINPKSGEEDWQVVKPRVS